MNQHKVRDLKLFKDHQSELTQSIVRVSDEILTQLREILPEFKDESDANLVRVALRKFIYEAKTHNQTRIQDLEKQWLNRFIEELPNQIAELKAIREKAEKERPEWQERNR